MSDIAKGAVIGVVVAILGLGLLIEASGILFPRPETALTVARLGPDGVGDSFFGDGVVDMPVPGSEGYGFCTGELKVLRPPMMISNMPDAWCSLKKGADGKWLVSTGGWQECRVVCVRTSPGGG